MCVHSDSSAGNTFTPARRTALGMLGAAALGFMTGCASPRDATADRFQSPPPMPPGGPGVSARARPPRKTFVPDYHLPPVVNGLAPVVTKVETAQPVVFLTIDDGNVKMPEMVNLMAKHDYPASLFLTRNAIADDPAFFDEFKGQGSLVENHTVSHNVFMVHEWNYEQQLKELTGMQEYCLEQYGRKPRLFRPPGGSYSSVMQAAVAAAGMSAIIHWEVEVRGGQLIHQVGNSLRPGDIVLMHFRAEFADDLAAFRQAQLAAGLEVVLLEDFLGVA